jgi:hypothetical protein
VGRSHAGKNRIHTVKGREDYNSGVPFLRNECLVTHINPRKSKTFTPYPLSCNFEPIRRYSNAARTISRDGTIRIGLATPLPAESVRSAKCSTKRSEA